MTNFKSSFIFLNWMMKPVVVFGVLTALTLGFLSASFSVKVNHEEDERKNDSLRVVNYKPSVLDSTDLSLFKVDSKSYYLNASIENSWKAYRNVNPAHAWQGPISELIIIYDESGFNVLDKFKQGCIVLVRVNLFKNKPTKALFKISKIDDKNHVIEMTYGKNNNTTGLQRIAFASENGKTIINHTAYFKCKSGFRDMFYPRYHQKVIDEFHNRVHASISGSTEK